MKEIWVWIQAALAAVGGFLGWFLGGWDGFLYALLAFAVLDYLTGVLCAIADKKLSSEIGFKGISAKCSFSRWWVLETSSTVRCWETAARCARRSSFLSV